MGQEITKLKLDKFNKNQEDDIAVIEVAAPHVLTDNEFRIIGNRWSDLDESEIITDRKAASDDLNRLYLTALYYNRLCIILAQHKSWSMLGKVIFSVALFTVGLYIGRYVTLH